MAASLKFPQSQQRADVQTFLILPSGSFHFGAMHANNAAESRLMLGVRQRDVIAPCKNSHILIVQRRSFLASAKEPHADTNSGVLF